MTNLNEEKLCSGQNCTLDCNECYMQTNFLPKNVLWEQISIRQEFYITDTWTFIFFFYVAINLTKFSVKHVKNKWWLIIRSRIIYRSIILLETSVFNTIPINFIILIRCSLYKNNFLSNEPFKSYQCLFNLCSTGYILLLQFLYKRY